MFTGIIESLGTIASLSLDDRGGRVTIHCPQLASELAIGNSIAVNGCCLTVVSAEAESFSGDLSGRRRVRTGFWAASGRAQPPRTSRQPTPDSPPPCPLEPGIPSFPRFAVASERGNRPPGITAHPE